jgi:hypothetical protein
MVTFERQERQVHRPSREKRHRVVSARLTAVMPGSAGELMERNLGTDRLRRTRERVWPLAQNDGLISMRFDTRIRFYSKQSPVQVQPKQSRYSPRRFQTITEV